MEISPGGKFMKANLFQHLCEMVQRVNPTYESYNYQQLSGNGIQLPLFTRKKTASIILASPDNPARTIGFSYFH